MEYLLILPFNPNLRLGAINISILQMRKLKLRKVQKLAEGHQLASGSRLSSWTSAQVLLAALLFILQLPREGLQRAPQSPQTHADAC